MLKTNLKIGWLFVWLITWCVMWVVYINYPHPPKTITKPETTSIYVIVGDKQYNKNDVWELIEKYENDGCILQIGNKDKIPILKVGD